MHWYPPPDYRANPVAPSPAGPSEKHGFAWKVASTALSAAAAAATSATVGGLMYSLVQSPATSGAFGWIGPAARTMARYLPMMRYWSDATRRASLGVSITSVAEIPELMTQSFRGALNLLTPDPARNGPLIPTYTSVYLQRTIEMWNISEAKYWTSLWYYPVANVVTFGDDVDTESMTQIPLDVTDSYRPTQPVGFEVSAAHPINVMYDVVWDSRLADGSVNTYTRCCGMDCVPNDSLSPHHMLTGRWIVEIYPNFPNPYGSNDAEDDVGESHVETDTPTTVYFFDSNGNPV